ncbi:hypothetical protein [Jongsikchunia kroppenstedtii]|uniref:hypothetical protein n=1 Tax=Jongsikchunia kroppenstedtii TaxID=1121721 RepID=UPI000366EBD9|nr:hypothetical protein [Jongsikchunia kroppenstedtii]
MTQGDSYGGDQSYADADQQYAGEPYPPAEQPEPQNGSKVSVPTILASAGVAAIISALIVTIGVVGLVIADNNRNDNNASSQTPTVVNLGAAAQTAAAGAPQQAAGAPAAPQAGAQPTAAGEQVPESGGGGAPQGAGTPQAQAQAPAAQQTQQAAGPQALTAGQLNTKIKLIMNTGASNAQRADELQGGARALGSINQVAEMLRVSGAGFTYQMVGPVKLNGTTLTANLQMSLVGNGSRYRQLSWIWMDNKWKLSNASVCDIAAYAMIPCTV